MLINYAAQAAVASSGSLVAPTPGRAVPLSGSPVTAPRTTLADLAADAGIRLTKHRLTVIAVLERAYLLGDVLPIPAIAERARDDFDQVVPEAAVYRAVRQLRAAGIVTRAISSDDQIGYRITPGLPVAMNGEAPPTDDERRRAAQRRYERRRRKKLKRDDPEGYRTKQREYERSSRAKRKQADPEAYLAEQARRLREWRRQRKAVDPSYKDRLREQNKAWLEKNPEYREKANARRRKKHAARVGGGQ